MNCDSNSRLVVDEDDNLKIRLERVKIECALNLETLIIYVETLISQVTQIFGHLKLSIAVARHNFKCLKIKLLSSVF